MAREPEDKAEESSITSPISVGQGMVSKTLGIFKWLSGKLFSLVERKEVDIDEQEDNMKHGLQEPGDAEICADDRDFEPTSQDPRGIPIRLDYDQTSLYSVGDIDAALEASDGIDETRESIHSSGTSAGDSHCDASDKSETQKSRGGGWIRAALSTLFRAITKSFRAMASAFKKAFNTGRGSQAKDYNEPSGSMSTSVPEQPAQGNEFKRELQTKILARQSQSAALTSGEASLVSGPSLSMLKLDQHVLSPGSPELLTVQERIDIFEQSDIQTSFIGQGHSSTMPALSRSDAFRGDQKIESAREKMKFGNVDRLNSSRAASNQQEGGIVI